jgi:hypothetical protein
MFRLCIGIFVLSLSTTAWASNGNIGLGAIIGSPTGISAAYKLSNRNAVDAAFGWSLSDDVNFHIHSTYLWLKPAAFVIDDIDINVYYGIGGRIKDRDTRDKNEDFRLGARAPLGVHYQFDDPPIEIFAEVALILDVLEETDVDFNLALGARFWF